MKRKLTRTEAFGRIEEFFKKKSLKSEEVRKIKRLAMLYNIKLGKYRKRFCKKCYSDLKTGKVKSSKGFRNVECSNCGNKSRWKIKIS
jgi:RNase P subunit RPR2